MEEYWELDVKNWEKISISSADKCLQLAEETFDHYQSVSNSITNRSYTLLAVYVTFISFLVSYVDSESAILNLPVWVMILLLSLFVISFSCFLILIGPRKTSTPGRSPKELDPFDEYVQLGMKKEKDLSYLALIVSQIENVQAQIDFLHISNSWRLIVFLVGLISEGLMFVIFLISLMISA
ncbi:MAG: hypothetical protein K8R35_09590 [Bacteroidales bacterium]|nr:hypothetical protein [Bacteroidales bacterium]